MTYVISWNLFDDLCNFMKPRNQDGSSSKYETSTKMYFWGHIYTKDLLSAITEKWKKLLLLKSIHRVKYNFSTKFPGEKSFSKQTIFGRLMKMMKIISCFFVIWLTNERRLALFPAETIVGDSHHRESPTRREQDLNLRKQSVYWNILTKKLGGTASAFKHFFSPKYHQIPTTTTLKCRAYVFSWRKLNLGRCKWLKKNRTFLSILIPPWK